MQEFSGRALGSGIRSARDSVLQKSAGSATRTKKNGAPGPRSSPLARCLFLAQFGPLRQALPDGGVLLDRGGELLGRAARRHDHVLPLDLLAHLVGLLQAVDLLVEAVDDGRRGSRRREHAVPAVGLELV